MGLKKSLAGKSNPSVDFRPEIQGLRALAVGLVLAFHLWPQVLPGGYVGVDVFFVISGFLITRLLYREIDATGRIGIVRFYARRSSRLIPAATLVLMVVLVATLLFRPPSLREDTAWEVLFSALYVENWHLAWLSVDYLDAENAASPVQHYWSLSIEEQFYLVWPAVMMLAARFLPLWNKRLKLLLATGAITALSFACALYFSTIEPASAYFMTHTRMWELGVGAMLAFAPARLALPRIGAEALRIVGLCAIIGSALTFSALTPYPGAYALLPTLGAAAMILASGTRTSAGVGRFLAAPPVRYVGDVSYSLYLWHWPIIVFHLGISPGSVSVTEGVLLAGLSLAAAAATKALVEDPLRGTHGRRGIGIRTGVAAMGVTAIAALAVIVPLQVRPVRDAEVQARGYPGPQALLAGTPVPAGVPPRPDPALVKRDLPETYDNGCHRGGEDPELVGCQYGNTNGKMTVFLVGDSHAAQWQPALDFAARELDWNLQYYTKSGCGFYSSPLVRDGERNLSCEAWGQALLATIADDPPDLVIWTGYRGARVWLEEEGAPGDLAATATALAATWHEISRVGSRVLVIFDTPVWPTDPAECLTTPATCVLPRADPVPPDPARLAFEQGNETVTGLDPTDMFCDPEYCHAIVGNVVVWRDLHHMTATYSAMLGPELASRLRLLTSNTP